MSAAQLVKSEINHMRTGAPFTISAFHHLGTTENIRKILERLVKSGKIQRLARGFFAKPKKIKHVGETLPSIQETIKAIAKVRGEVIVPHGAEAARQLHLTTQAPLKMMLYTTGYSRKIKIRNRTVVLRHISPRKLVAPGTITCTVILALWYLGKNEVTTATIEKINQQLSSQEFNTVLQYTQSMPAWMAKIFFIYNQKQKELTSEQQLL